MRTEVKECGFQDLAKLEEYNCRAKRELRFAGIFVFIISFILPFLPPKYSGQKAMLDIMSYSDAVLGIIIVFAVVFLWSLYFMLYGIHKDLKQKIKIVLYTRITSVNAGKYRGKKYNYFSAAGLPFALSRINIPEDGSSVLKKGDAVVIEYSKYGKKLLGWKSISNE